VALYIWFEKTDGLVVLGFTEMDMATKVLLAVSITASGFILHELGHKFTAQHFGHWSEFRANWFGLAAAIAVAYFLGFIIALPGATWHTASNRKENGKVSATGPLVNVLVMLAAFPFAAGAGPGETVANIAVAVVLFNGILALVNLIPLGPLDGKKILKWNPIFYLALVALAVAVFIWTGAAQIFYAPEA
jgi:Zn-dependent protease